MRVIFTLVLVLLAVGAISQNRWAVADGLWSDPNTWATTQGGTPGASVPPASSTVFTDGFSVTVDQNVTIANLRILNQGENQLVFGDSDDPVIITISGNLRGVNAGGGFSAPTEPVIEDSPGLVFRFTTASSLGFIRDWSYAAPLNSVIIDPGEGNICVTNNSTGNLAVSESLVIASGSFRPRRNVADAWGIAVLTVEEGASLLLNGPGASITGDGTLNTSFNQIDINGTVNIAANKYLNTNIFNISSTGILTCSNRGANQTESWWYQSVRPTNGAVDPNSTIRFNAAGSQNVYARTYGNLILDGSGTKTVPNSATLNVDGDLTITSTAVTLSTGAASGINIGGDLVNDGIWSPTLLVTFDGSTAGTIGGAQVTSFFGGLRINKTGNALSIVTGPVISNGINISSGTLSLGDVTTTLNSGNVTANSGTVLTSGLLGTLLVQTSSQFSGAGSFTLNNLISSSTGIATFNSNINFTGDIINNGSLVFPSSVDVTFNGGNDQSLSGNPFSIYDLIVNKTSSTLSNNTTFTLMGNLTMTTGTFDADGSGGQFILNSDTNGDASIGPMAGGSITGNVTFRRYFNNTVINRYRNFAFPVTGVTVDNLRSFITIVNGSFARYDETVLGNRDQGWIIINNGTLSSNTAYKAGMYTAAPITFSFTGPLFKNLPTTATEPHVYNITYTNDPAQTAQNDGWNFVPNPYACPINWNAASGWTKGSGVNAVASIWDAAAGAYRYSGTTWDGVVAQGQSFWVHTSSSVTTLRSTESVKVINSDPTFYRKRSEVVLNNRLMVRLEDGKNFDVATIQYNELATPEFDGSFDAFKLKNSIFNVSTLTQGGDNLAVNVMPKSACASSVKLDVNNIVPGSYRLVFDSLVTFSALKKLTLVDQFTNEEIEVTEGLSYGFSVTSDSESWGTERFELRFSFADVHTAEPVVSSDGQRLISSYETGNQWLLNGQPIMGENSQTLLPTAEGDYQVIVSNGQCLFESNVLTVKEIPHRIYPNPARESFTIDLQGILEDSNVKSGYIYLYSLNGQLMLKAKFAKDEMDKLVTIGHLKAGEYVVAVTVGDTKIVAQERLLIK